MESMLQMTKTMSQWNPIFWVNSPTKEGDTWVSLFEESSATDPLRNTNGANGFHCEIPNMSLSLSVQQEVIEAYSFINLERGKTCTHNIWKCFPWTRSTWHSYYPRQSDKLWARRVEKASGPHRNDFLDTGIWWRQKKAAP